MARQTLRRLSDFANFHNGRLDAAFAHSLGQALQDIEARPSNGKPRKVKLELALHPSTNENGLLSTVTFTHACTCTLPPQTSATYNVALKTGQPVADGIEINEASPDNIKQGTLDELAKEEPNNG
jgi:hypothetical protein